MKKITTLLLAILMVLPAMAVNMTGGEVLYLTPNANWKKDNARFAMYLCNGSTEATWVSMEKVDDVYSAKVPSGNYKNVIFCRMNPSNQSNSWDTRWNQTDDLLYDGTKNHYTVKEGTWDKGGGTWSVYETQVPETPGELTYNVTVPIGTVECYIVGQMVGWESFTKMEKIDDTHFTITLNNVTKSMEYKYACGQDWAYQAVDEEGNECGNRTWSEEDVVIAWKAIAPIDDITFGVYCLDISESQWDTAEAWFSAYFYNETSNIWVRGVVEEGKVYFGLEDKVNTYTNVVFARFSPKATQESWDDKEEDVDGTPKMLWNKTNDLPYIKPANGVAVYKVVDWNAAVLTNETVVATGLDRVEMAGGIGYAYGVVSAEGAIEVYNVNGAVVARGNDTIDLRGLGRGVYIIRNGNQVRKVVR